MDELSLHIYFSANTIARKLSKMADDHFKPFGFTSSYAFMIMAVNRNSGLSQKEVSTLFQLAPSTVTRFVDKLVKMGLMERKQDGKEVMLVLTPKGKEMVKRIEDEFALLNTRISEAWGDKYLDTLNRMARHGIQMLDEQD